MTCVPGEMSSNSMGVVPIDCPSTKTLAPAGCESMLNVPANSLLVGGDDA
jgi:hypothetical protein